MAIPRATLGFSATAGGGCTIAFGSITANCGAISLALGARAGPVPAKIEGLSRLNFSLTICRGANFSISASPSPTHVARSKKRDAKEAISEHTVNLKQGIT